MEELSPETLARMIQFAGGMLLMVGMVVGLLWMSRVMTRQHEAAEQQVETTWRGLSQQLGLSTPGRVERVREMKGDYRGRPLSIHGRYAKGKNYDYTQVAVKVAYQSDLYLQAITWKALGFNYLQAGDEELDRRYYFRSDPPELLASTLTHPAVRNLLLQSRASWLTVTPYAITCSVRGIEKDQQRLLLLADLVSTTADVVAQQVGAGIAAGPPREPDHYLFFGARRIEGTAARALALLALVALIACTVVGVVAASNALSNM